MPHLSKWLRYCIGVMLLSLLPVRGWAARSSVQYRWHVIKNIPVHVIIVDLRDDSLQLTPRIAHGRSGRLQSFRSFHNTHRPLAQITGSFFDTRRAISIGDIIVNHRRYAGGSIGSALVVKPDNTAGIMELPRGEKSRWDGYESVLRGGIRLVENGKWSLSPRDQGFREGAVYSPAPRTAVGLQSKKDLLLVVVQQRISLSQLTIIMKALGCWDAMALDGGSSVGLAYNGTIMVNPSRALVTVLTVVEREAAAPPKRPHRRQSRKR